MMKRLWKYCSNLSLFNNEERQPDQELIDLCLLWMNYYRLSLFDYTLTGEKNQWFYLYKIAQCKNELIKRGIVQFSN